MSLEKISIKEERTKEEKVRDRVFYSLVEIMVHDYHKIQEEFKDYVPFEVGTEFTTHLHGAIILLDPSNKEIRKYCKKIKYYEDPLSIHDKNFIQGLTLILKADDARVIQDDEIVLKAGVYAYNEAEKRIKGGKKEDRLDAVIETYYANIHASEVGERLTAALSFAVATRNNVFAMYQTINKARRDIKIEGVRYSKIGTGRVEEFGPNEVIRTVRLNNGDEDIPKEDLLHKDIYIEHYSYNFDKSDNKVHLSRRSYLTIDDVFNLKK